VRCVADLDGCNELVVGNHDRLVCAYSLQCRSDAVDVLRTSGKVLHAEQYHLHQRGRWRMNEQVVSLCLTYSLEPVSANPVAAAAAATSPTSPTNPETSPATPQQQPPSNESATRSPASPPRSPTAPSGTPSTPTSPAEALTPSAPRTPTSQSSPSPPAATATAPKPLIVVGLQGASYAVISFTEGVLTEANGGLSPPSVPTTRTSKHGVLTEVAGPIWRLAADAASPRPRSSHPRSRSGKSAGSSPAAAAAAGAAAAAAPTSHADLSTVIPISALASRASPSDADDEAAPEPRGTPLVAIATLDGMLTLQQQQDSSSSVLWTQQVLHQLFAVFPFGYERELIAACAWNGMTYIIDQQRNMVRFRFPERVCTFYAGEYAVHAGGANEPCLVYVTFNDRIFVYYNLGLDRIGASNLLEAMQDDFQHYRVLKENQESLGTRTGELTLQPHGYASTWALTRLCPWCLHIEWTFQEQASLIHSCLYHPMNTAEQQAYQTTLQERLSQVRPYTHGHRDATNQPTNQRLSLDRSWRRTSNSKRSYSLDDSSR